MAQIVKGVIVEVDTTSPQTDLDSQLDSLAIPADDFLAAQTISFEEQNNKAKVLVLYAEEE